MDTSFARSWLRGEGAATLVAAALLYGHFHLPWLWFGVLFLAPDLALLAYVAGARFGAWCYNAAHSYLLPSAMLTLGLLLPGGTIARDLVGLALIWCAHISFDRALGYGLKSVEGFRFTHLGRIGRER
jgi:hypothetical protein